MGSWYDKSDYVKNTLDKAKSLQDDKNELGNKIIKEEIIKRAKNDDGKNKIEESKEKIDKDKQKFELNIYIYSNDKISNYLYNSIKNINEEIYNWKKKEFIGFSPENSKLLSNICQSDFKKKDFKNSIIIPIKSISNFNNIITENDKDIFSVFNELNEEKQPFFLIIDENQNDFIENKENISVKTSDDDKEKLDYFRFIGEIFDKIKENKRLEKDFQLKIDLDLNSKIKLDKFKEYINKKKNNNEDFEIFINNHLFYQYLFGIENIDIILLEEKIEENINSDRNIDISLIIYNINLTESFDYEIFEIKNVEFSSFFFKKNELNKILRKEKYQYLDKRNFKVIRAKQSPKYNLIKYTGYFNQIGDILLLEQIPYYSAKINIAIAGYIGSGKSTLINTIIGEKRCLEGKGGSMTNYISQFALKEYALNFYDFPGFRAKINGKENTSLFIDEIKSKISDLKKMNEAIHCFLFCIKFEQRIFDENEDEIKEVFKIMMKLEIRTFFIITSSEREDTREFHDFKEIIINNLESFRNNLVDIDKKSFDKIFGDDLSYSIIPIYSKDKISHGNRINAFGLDDLFKKLYEYFKNKKINLDKDIYSDDKKLDQFIKENELLKIFESKKKLGEDFKRKIEKEMGNMLIKLFVQFPTIFYNFSEEEEKANEVINYLVELLFNLIYCYLSQHNDIEKYQIINQKFYKIKSDIIDPKKIKKYFEDLKQGTKKLRTIPWYAKAIIIPILIPGYYTVGFVILKAFINKIINNYFGEDWRSTFIYDFFLSKLIIDFNNGIDGLEKMKNYFEIHYEIDKLGGTIFKIFNEIDKEKKKNYLEDLEKTIKDFLKKYNKDLQIVKDFIFEIVNFETEDVDINEFKIKIKNVFENY